jgi:predicted NBD/HSP70 family sugar kinase
VLARQDVELAGVDAFVARGAIAELCQSLVEATGRDRSLIDGAVVGVPGVVDATTGEVALARVPALDGRRFAVDLEERLGLAVTVENDINLAALGERWQGVADGVDDFVFLSIGTGMGAGLVLRGELHRGHHGAAGEVDYVLADGRAAADPSAEGVAALVSQLVADGAAGTALVPPYEARDVFAAARRGDALGRAVVDEVARRIALHVAPIAAVTDVGLVVLGGGIGANGDLLLEPVRSLLAEWLPYPPRVEVSTLGEAAVLTGALAVGLRSALENVFERRPLRASL